MAWLRHRHPDVTPGDVTVSEQVSPLDSTRPWRRRPLQSSRAWGSFSFSPVSGSLQQLAPPVSLSLTTAATAGCADADGVAADDGLQARAPDLPLGAPVGSCRITPDCCCARRALLAAKPRTDCRTLRNRLHPRTACYFNPEPLKTKSDRRRMAGVNPGCQSAPACLTAPFPSCGRASGLGHAPFWSTSESSHL